MEENIGSKFNRKTLVSLIIIIILILGLAVGLYLIKNPQIFKSRASEQKAQALTLEAKSRSYSELIEKKIIKPAEPILEVQLFYSENQQPTFTIINTQRKIGYVPKYQSSENNIKLEIVDNQDKIIYQMPFELPTKLYDPPPLTGEEQSNFGPLDLKQVRFTLTLPWFDNTDQIKIRNKEGAVLAVHKIPAKSLKIQAKKQTPSFKTVFGDEFLDSKKSLSKSPAGGPDSKQYLDITFIGHGYSVSQMDQFHSDISRLISHLLTYEPFKSRAEQISFHYVDNTESLGCASQPTNRQFGCDFSKATAKINDAGVPYDNIYILINTSYYGGSGGSGLAQGYNGEWGPEVFVHELGHSFGALWDEYVYDYNINGPIDNLTHKNCYGGNHPPAKEWYPVVAISDYGLGCSEPNYYRSSPLSIMVSVGVRYFNTISQIFLNEQLDIFAGSFQDLVRPTAVISSPAAGESVSGKILVAAFATDDRGIARVELWKDNTLFQTKYSLAPTPPPIPVTPTPHPISGPISATIGRSAPTAVPSGDSNSNRYFFEWKTNRDQNGEHTLQVRAYDTKGNVTASQAIKVPVDNPADTTAPTVLLSLSSYPSHPLFIIDQTMIYASAYDNVDAFKLQFYIDNKLIREEFEPSYRIWWDAPKATEGPHTITVKAYDWAGNMAESTKEVTVKYIDAVPPIVDIFSFRENSVVPIMKDVWFGVKARDNYVVNKVEFFMDDRLIGSDNFRPDNRDYYSIRWDTSWLPTGTKLKLYAKAYDWKGNVAASKVVNVTVADIFPPAAIYDLVANANASDKITLSWTAPGDDWYSGTASSYDIRFADVPITAETEWEKLPQPTNPPKPAASGTRQTFIITGLTPGKKYYFAIKTLDEVPNISYMSNIATAATPLQDKFSCTACTADIVRSTLNRVDAQDNALLSSCFGKDPATTLPGGRSCTPADINKDGSVNQADVDCLRSVYFQTCTASP